MNSNNNDRHSIDEPLNNNNNSSTHNEQTYYSKPNVNKCTSRFEKAAKRRQNRTTALLIAMACSYAVLWFPFTVVSMIIDMNILYIVSDLQKLYRILILKY